MSNRSPEWCACLILDREENEEEREWFKRVMCMYHWMQTDYYKGKLKPVIEDRYQQPKIYD